MFPEYLRNNKEYRKYVDELAELVGYEGDLIELFPSISRIDDSSEEFLKLIAETIGYKYDTSNGSYAQRDIMRRSFDALSVRGTEKSLKKSAARSIDENWYREELTYYKDKIREQTVRIVFPESLFFTLNKSTLSGYDKFPSVSTWSVGMIVLYVEEFSESMMDAVLDTLPTGRKLLIIFVKVLQGEDNDGDKYPWSSIGSFGVLSYNYDKVNNYTILNKDIELLETSKSIVLSGQGGLSVPDYFMSGTTILYNQLTKSSSSYVDNPYNLSQLEISHTLLPNGDPFMNGILIKSYRISIDDPYPINVVYDKKINEQYRDSFVLFESKHVE